MTFIHAFFFFSFFTSEWQWREIMVCVWPFSAPDRTKSTSKSWNSSSCANWAWLRSSSNMEIVRLLRKCASYHLFYQTILKKTVRLLFLCDRYRLAGFLVERFWDVVKWGSLVPKIHWNLPILFPVHERTWLGWITRHGLGCQEAGHSVWGQARGLDHHQCL